MGKLSKSELVKRLALKSFKQCDLDDSGSIDVKELHVGLLLVFDKLNKSLPVYIKPPSHDEVKALLAKHDADGSERLDFEEFHQCVRTVVGVNEKSKFTESLTFRIISRTALKMVVFPLAALAVKRLLVGVAGEKAEKVPNSVLAVGVEGLYKVGVVALEK